MQKIRIKYFTDKIDKLEYIEGKSDWIDLRASETVELKAGEFKLIPLGVAMEPTSYHAVPLLRIMESFRRTAAVSLTVPTVEMRICGECRFMQPETR